MLEALEKEQPIVRQILKAIVFLYPETLEIFYRIEIS
jgi:hypothetical protein